MRFLKNPSRSLIYDLERENPGLAEGNKAANLRRLRKLGMRTPKSWVLTWEGYRRYLCSDVSVVEQIRAEIRRKLPPDRLYAVRSSASLEDSFEHSFAGQFKSVLNVPAGDAILQAVWAVWATTQTPEVQQYLQKRELGDSALKMAVLLQEMVTPHFSGVAFSRNPLTGMRETVVEAVRGEGTRLVQEGATPLRWVYHSGRFTTCPEQSDLPQVVVEEIVAGTRQAARKLNRDVDLEWVYDGSALYWVQMREITSLRSVRVYSNRLAREMIGGLIKPLIWSVNIPMVGGVWTRLMAELLGTVRWTPHDLVRPFYYRAYFNMGLLGEIFEDLGFPAESLEMMWGLVPDGGAGAGSKGSSMKMMPREMPPISRMARLLPRAARFLWGKSRLVSSLESRLPGLEAQFRSFDLSRVETDPPEALLREVDRLYVLVHEAAYLNVIIPMAMYVYSTLLRKQLARCGVDMARIDFTEDSAEFHRYNPNTTIEKLWNLFSALPCECQEAIRRAPTSSLEEIHGIEEFREGFLALLHDFGSLCDHGNDFSSPPWRETPDMILRLVTDFSPAPRQAGQETVEKIHWKVMPVRGARRWVLDRLYVRARRLMLQREHISYVYTFGYGLFRNYFMAIARDLAARGILDSLDDIFYLSLDEVRGAVSGAGTEGLCELVARRRQEIESVRGVELPEVVFGDEAPPVKVHSGAVLKGTATSRGYTTGPARVVSGLADFPRVQPGDVLVIPYSDVGWTPLFTRAGAVIAEAGGMLSHSSIVAREYGIPAVVSVPGATDLPDGALVSVNGFTGEIILHHGGPHAGAAC